MCNRRLVNIIAAAAVALGVCYSSSADNQTAPAAEVQEAAGVYQQVQEAVSRDDIHAVLRLVNYPLLYGDEENRVSEAPSSVKTPGQLRAHYHQIFTDTIKRLLSCRSADELIYDGEHIIIGDGSVWLARSYPADNIVSRPVDTAKKKQSWPIKIVAVYDGIHARRDLQQCEGENK